MQGSTKNHPYTEQIPCSLIITTAIGVIALLGRISLPMTRVLS